MSTARTEAELAEAMYGGGLQQPQGFAPVGQPVTPDEGTNGENAEAPAARSQEEIAADLYKLEEEVPPLDEVPEEIQELRDDPARRMYSPQVTYAKAIPDSVFIDHDGISVESGKKAARELREMAADLDMSVGDVQAISECMALAAAKTADPGEQRSRAIAALKNAFGDTWHQALEDGKKLMRRDPRTAKIVKDTGIGNDPRVVMMFARAARSQRLAGKLK